MNRPQTSIRCSVIRGGTSRGVYFAKQDLPASVDARNKAILAVLGGPDELQVDGIGGGHPLTNKVAIVAPSDRDDADVDYLFLQANPAAETVSESQNCGNILAGVGAFAIDSGWVVVSENQTVVRVHMVNSGNLAELTIATVNGAVQYDGDTRIDGVPGTGAPVFCDFLDVAGSVTGALLPTGRAVDEIDGQQVTCIDNGMPIVVVPADALNKTGNESPDELEADLLLKKAVESLRLKSGELMGLGDVSSTTVPKVCLVSRPGSGGAINTRMFIPHTCHRSIGVLGAVSVATACLIRGSVAASIAVVPGGDESA